MDRQGFTLLSVAIGTALLMTAVVAVLSVFGRNMAQAEHVNENISGAVTRNNLGAILSNPTAWSATVADQASNGTCNATLACLSQTGGCGVGLKTAPIQCIYDVDGTLIFDGRVATSGFGIDGQPCSSFDAIKGNQDCPFRPTFTWSPVCATAPCIGTPLIVYVDFQYSSVAGNSFNAGKLSFQVRP